MDISQITALIDALRAETARNAITPERIGIILQAITDALDNLGVSANAILKDIEVQGNIFSFVFETENGEKTVVVPFSAVTPTIDANTGNWKIGEVITNYPSRGEKGNDGSNAPIPYIGDGGYWYVDGVSTGVKAQGPAGDINISEGETPTLTIVKNLTTDDDEQDNIKVLSAGMGKLLFQLITQVSQSAGGVSVNHSQGVTNIVIGGGGGSALPVTASPTITVTDSGVNKLVTITNDAEETGAAIYYTTDGTEPTIQSTLYTEPFVFSTEGTSTIKAIAVSNGKLPSTSATEEVVIAPFWTDGVIFSSSGISTVEDEDMSISDYIPLSGGGYVWVWNGVPFSKVASSSHVSLAIYDGDKNYLGGFYDTHMERIYNVQSIYKSKSTAYIRVLAATAEKSRVIIKKLANNTAGSNEGEFLYKGSAITNFYDTISPFTRINAITSSNVSLVRTGPPDSNNYASVPIHGAITQMFDVSKYSKIYFHHLTAEPTPSSKFAFVQSFNNSGVSNGYYNNGYGTPTVYPDPRVWTVPIEGNVKFKFMFNGILLHDCYLKGEWTEDGETKTEYLFKGANVE